MYALDESVVSNEILGRGNADIHRVAAVEPPSECGRSATSVQCIVRCLPCQIGRDDCSSLFCASRRYASVSPFQSARILRLAAWSSSSTGFCIFMFHQKIQLGHRPTSQTVQLRSGAYKFWAIQLRWRYGYSFALASIVLPRVQQWQHATRQV